MRVRRAILWAAVAVIAVVGYALVRGSIRAQDTSYGKIIWESHKGSPGIGSVMSFKKFIGARGYEGKKTFVYRIGYDGRMISRKELASDGTWFVDAGGSRDGRLYSFISKTKKPVVVDMERLQIYRPVLDPNMHAMPMQYIGPPATSALCPCGKTMLVHGHDKKNGKVRYRAWLVDSISGMVVREVDRPKGVDTFYYYVWNDDCTLTWLDPQTGLIRNEKKGILSDACKELLPKIPEGDCIRLSPDASTIAVYDPEMPWIPDITFYDTATGRKKREVELTIRWSEKIVGAYWSPDSSKLCVGLLNGRDSVGFTDHVYVIGQDGSIEKLSMPGWQFFGFHESISWMDDSNHLVCLLTDSHDDEHQAIAVFDVDKE